MANDPAELASIPIDANFEIWGRAAKYRPPASSRLYGAAPIDCTVILDKADQVDTFGDTRIVSRGTDRLEVRAAEIATPEAEGVFTVGSKSYRVVGAPKSEDPETLVWACVVM